MAVSIAIVALSGSVILTALALAVGGAAWMISITLFNIGIQLSVPRWVAGRALAAFQAAIAGGIAIGSWIWGDIAETYDVHTALLASAAVMAATPLLGRWLPLAPIDDRDKEPVELGEPDVALALTARSGPLVVEIEYRVDPADRKGTRL